MQRDLRAGSPVLLRAEVDPLVSEPVALDAHTRTRGDRDRLPRGGLVADRLVEVQGHLHAHPVRRPRTDVEVPVVDGLRGQRGERGLPGGAEPGRVRTRRRHRVVGPGV